MPSSLVDAMKEVNFVFSVQDFYDKDSGPDNEILQAKNLIEAAKDAQVDFFIQSTMAQGENFESVPHFYSKKKIENLVIQSGINYAFIGTVWFLENILDAKKGGKITFPVLSGSLQKDTMFYMLSVEDIGKLVAKILIKPDMFNSKRFDLAGDVLTISQMKQVYRKASKHNGKSWWIPMFIMKFLAPEFVSQLKWQNETNWSFDASGLEENGIAPITFEKFLIKHNITFL